MVMEKQSSAKPFEPTRDFTMVHNAIFTLYTRLPKFKADHALLYMYLMARYNTAYGYAFPTTEDIALAMNCGKNVIKGYKEVLVAYGLVTIRRHPRWGNDLYVVHAPISEPAAFYARFPEAREHEAKRKATLGIAVEVVEPAQDTWDSDAITAWL
ncbi:helix-turn-helix domain-containing protein [Paenibacillus sp. FSL R10-2779]|uniref:helix-turn-helix domain-containing protein n=1 Tax=Paenibacillus sp. FSL R10-2779 TaxID=2975340 RepID=UPI004046D09E